jgi:hypothetical protein
MATIVDESETCVDCRFMAVCMPRAVISRCALARQAPLKEQPYAKALQAILLPTDGQKQKLCKPPIGAKPRHRHCIFAPIPPESALSYVLFGQERDFIRRVRLPSPSSD